MRAGSLLATILLAGGLIVAVAVSKTPYSTGSAEPTVMASVVHVVDGDTLDVMLDDQKVRLRLIGMDTPETVDPRKAVQCYGPEASARAHQLLDNQRVGISTDQSQGDRDRYGRKLAYVWLPDGRNYAETMIRDGYAREYTYDKAYIYKVAFKLAQEDAQREHAGLWGKCS